MQYEYRNGEVQVSGAGAPKRIVRFGNDYLLLEGNRVLTGDVGKAVMDAFYDDCVRSQYGVLDVDDEDDDGVQEAAEAAMATDPPADPPAA